MSFFSQNASVQSSAGGGDFEIAESGTYNCRLIAVEMGEQPDFNDPSVMKPIFRWVFETVDQFDSQDRPFRFTKFTGRTFGNEKAHLTNLVNQMMGRALTNAEFLALDLNELMEKPWKVMVDEHTTQSNKVVNKIVSVRSPQKRGVFVDAVAKPTVQNKIKPVAADPDDPFQD